MTDREFADALRIRALRLLEDAARKLRPHHENKSGQFAPHVALDEVWKLRILCRQIEALAEVAGSIKK